MLALMRLAPGDQARGVMDRMSDFLADLGAGARITSSRRAAPGDLLATGCSSVPGSGGGSAGG